MKKTISLYIATGAIAVFPFTANADNPNHYGTNSDSAPPPAARTADDQSNDKEKVEMTRRIRERIVNDKSLSTAAHNITIVTAEDGEVTIRGPVQSAMEKEKILQIATSVVPGTRIHNEIVIENNR